MNEETNTPVRRTGRARKLNSRFANDELDDSFRKIAERINAPDSAGLLKSPPQHSTPCKKNDKAKYSTKKEKHKKHKDKIGKVKESDSKNSPVKNIKSPILRSINSPEGSPKYSGTSKPKIVSLRLLHVPKVEDINYKKSTDGSSTSDSQVYSPSHSLRSSRSSEQHNKLKSCDNKSSNINEHNCDRVKRKNNKHNKQNKRKKTKEIEIEAGGTDEECSPETVSDVRVSVPTTARGRRRKGRKNGRNKSKKECFKNINGDIVENLDSKSFSCSGYKLSDVEYPGKSSSVCEDIKTKSNVSDSDVQSNDSEPSSVGEGSKSKLNISDSDVQSNDSDNKGVLIKLRRSMRQSSLESNDSSDSSHSFTRAGKTGNKTRDSVKRKQIFNPIDSSKEQYENTSKFSECVRSPVPVLFDSTSKIVCDKSDSSVKVNNSKPTMLHGNKITLDSEDVLTNTLLHKKDHDKLIDTQTNKRIKLDQDRFDTEELTNTNSVIENLSTLPSEVKNILGIGLDFAKPIPLDEKPKKSIVDDDIAFNKTKGEINLLQINTICPKVSDKMLHKDMSEDGTTLAHSKVDDQEDKEFINSTKINPNVNNKSLNKRSKPSSSIGEIPLENLPEESKLKCIKSDDVSIEPECPSKHVDTNTEKVQSLEKDSLLLDNKYDHFVRDRDIEHSKFISAKSVGSKSKMAECEKIRPEKDSSTIDVKVGIKLMMDKKEDLVEKSENNNDFEVCSDIKYPLKEVSSESCSVIKSQSEEDVLRKTFNSENQNVPLENVSQDKSENKNASPVKSEDKLVSSDNLESSKSNVYSDISRSADVTTEETSLMAVLNPASADNVDDKTKNLFDSQNSRAEIKCLDTVTSTNEEIKGEEMLNNCLNSGNEVKPSITVASKDNVDNTDSTNPMIEHLADEKSESGIKSGQMGTLAFIKRFKNDPKPISHEPTKASLSKSYDTSSRSDRSNSRLSEGYYSRRDESPRSRHSRRDSEDREYSPKRSSRYDYDRRYDRSDRRDYSKRSRHSSSERDGSPRRSRWSREESPKRSRKYRDDSPKSRRKSNQEKSYNEPSPKVKSSDNVITNVLNVEACNTTTDEMVAPSLPLSSTSSEEIKEPNFPATMIEDTETEVPDMIGDVMSLTSSILQMAEMGFNLDTPVTSDLSETLEKIKCDFTDDNSSNENKCIEDPNSLCESVEEKCDSSVLEESTIIDQDDVLPTPCIEVVKTEEELKQEAEAKESKNKEVVEQRLKSFVNLTENAYIVDRKKTRASKEVRRMVCDCYLSSEEIAHGEMGCGEDCLNHLLMIECGSRCQLKDNCMNKQFQRCDYANIEVFNAEEKGCGVRACEDLSMGTFILEYVGEVFDSREFKRRRKEYARDSNDHFYFMALKSDQFIDATRKGNISRFVNHSCDPNAETQKWTVNGELRIGFFTTRSITKGEEINFDYRLERYGREPQKCYCGSAVCRGWLGESPDQKTKEEKVLERKEERDRRRREEKRAYYYLQLEDEIEKLVSRGIRNRQDTLNLSRLMVRAEAFDSRVALMRLVQISDQPCRRLFLDYLGLKLLWSWMADIGPALDNAQLKIEILKTLECIPIVDKTQLTDSKILSIVVKWSKQVPECINTSLDTPPITTSTPSVDTPPLATSTPTTHTPFPHGDPNKKSSDNSEDSDVEGVNRITAGNGNSCVDDSSLDSNDATKQSPEEESSDSNESPPSITNLDKEKEEFKSLDSEGSVSKEPSPQATPDREPADLVELQRTMVELALKLLTLWNTLKEAYRIPKKERIELMKEHEREVDQGYEEFLDEGGIVYKDRYNKRGTSYERRRHSPDREKERPWWIKKTDQDGQDSPKLSKEERRQRFEQKVAEDEAARQRKMQEDMWTVHVDRCRLLGHDPYHTPIFDPSGLYYWDPGASSWKPYTGPDPNLPVPANYDCEGGDGTSPMGTNQTDQQLTGHSIHDGEAIMPGHGMPRGLMDLASIPLPGEAPYLKTSPSHPLGPVDGTPPQGTIVPQSPLLPGLVMNEENPTPPGPVTIQLPPRWKLARNADGLLYFYHIKTRRSQWESPTLEQHKIIESQLGSDSESDSLGSGSSSTSSDSEDFSSDEDTEEEEEKKVVIEKIEGIEEEKLLRRSKGKRKKKRSEKLVQERVISPVMEIDRDMARKERREAKERAREEARQERREERYRALQDLDDIDDDNNNFQEGLDDPDDELLQVKPLYDAHTIERASRLWKQKVQQQQLLLQQQQQQQDDDDDQLVLTHQQQAIIQLKSRSSDKSSNKKVKSKERANFALADNSDFARRVKENFRAKMAHYIVTVLNPYRKSTCKEGRVTRTEDFKYLARKLTQFVMIKELKQLRSIEELDCTESVKHKTRDFVRKYMSKYGEVFKRDPNDTKEY